MHVPAAPRKTAVALALVAIAVAGCGGGGGAATTRAPRAATHARAAADLDGCLRAGRGVRLISFAGPGERVPAAIIGEGAIGVVFANQSGNSLCDWVPFARRLAAAGFRALVFDYGTGGQVAETADALRALRRTGARSTALVGASLGGMVAVRVAAHPPRGLDAVVTLSAERTARTMTDTLPFARRVRLPSLYVGTDQDGWTTAGADTRALHRVTPARVNRMVLLHGDEHGVEMLAGAHGRIVRPLIAGFIRAHGA